MPRTRAISLLPSRLLTALQTQFKERTDTTAVEYEPIQDHLLRGRTVLHGFTATRIAAA